MFSLRIVTSDHYMAPPLRNVDVVFSEFRQTEVKKVPVFRIFGASPAGQKTCMHVHGVFPYLYVPYDGTQPWNLYLYQFASSLDKAVNIALGNEHSKAQHVYKVSLVSGIPMYGYHDKEQQFLKIYLYNPNFVRRVADLLLGGAVLNKVFQPHESHISFPLQLFIDYNLYGMNIINVAAVKFRQSISSDEPAEKSPKQVTSDPLNQSVMEKMSGTNTPTLKYWHPHNIPRQMMMGSDVPRVSTCELEVDVVAADILNKQEVHDNLGNNPGLMALWEDERERKRDRGESTELTPPPSPVRSSVEEAESQQIMKERLLEILAEQQPYIDSQSSDNSEQGLSGDNEDAADNSICTPASTVEDHLSQLPDSEPSSQDTVIFDGEHEEELDKHLAAVVDRNSISRVVMSSQSFIHQDSSPPEDQPDQSLVEMLAALAGESSPEASQMIGSQVAALEEHDSILCGTPLARDEDCIALDEEEETEMSQSIWETNQPSLDHSHSDAHHDIEGFGNSLTESEFLDNIPQIDGPMDEKPVQNAPLRKRLGTSGPLISQTYRQADLQSPYLPSEELDQDVVNSCASWSNQEKPTDTMWYSSQPKSSQHLSQWEQQYTGTVSPPITRSPQGNPALSFNQFLDQDYGNIAYSQQFSNSQDSQFLRQNKQESQFDYKNNNADQSSSLSSFMNGSSSPLTGFVHNTTCLTSAGTHQNTYLASSSSFQNPSVGRFTDAGPTQSMNNPYYCSAKSYENIQQYHSPTLRHQLMSPPSPHIGSSQMSPSWKNTRYQEFKQTPDSQSTIHSPIHSPTSLQHCDSFNTPSQRQWQYKPFFKHNSLIPMHGIPSSSPELRSKFDYNVKRTLSTSFDSQEDLFADSASIRSRPLSSSSVGSKSSVCSENSYEMTNMYRESGVNSPPIPWHHQATTHHRGSSVISSLENFVSTVSKAEVYGATFSQQYGHEQFTSQNLSTYTSPGQSNHSASISATEHYGCQDRNVHAAPMIQNSEHVYRRTVSDNGMWFPLPHVDGQNIKGPLVKGKAGRMRKLGFSVKRRHSVALESPSKRLSSYSYTFNVPIPIYKRLKLQPACSFSRKCDITRVNMHPMDARRYSLLKIGCELVKTKRLTLPDICHINKGLKPERVKFDQTELHKVTLSSHLKTHKRSLRRQVCKKTKHICKSSLSGKMSNEVDNDIKSVEIKNEPVDKVVCSDTAELDENPYIFQSPVSVKNTGIKRSKRKSEMEMLLEITGPDGTICVTRGSYAKKNKLADKYTCQMKASTSSIVEVKNTGVHQQEIQLSEVENTELHTQEIHVSEVENTDLHKQEKHVSEVKNTDLYKQEIQLSEVENTDLYKQEIQLSEVENTDLHKQEMHFSETENTDIYKQEIQLSKAENMNLHNEEIHLLEGKTTDLHDEEIHVSEVSNTTNTDLTKPLESPSVMTQVVSLTERAIADKQNYKTNTSDSDVSNLLPPAVECTPQHISNLVKKPLDFEDKTADDNNSRYSGAISHFAVLLSGNNKKQNGVCHQELEKICSDVSSEPLASDSPKILLMPSTIEKCLKVGTIDNPKVNNENSLCKNIVEEGGDTSKENTTPQNFVESSVVNKKNDNITCPKTYPNNEKYPSFSVYGGNLPPSMAMYASVEPISSEDEASDSESKVCAYVTSNMTISPFSHLYNPGIKNERYFSQVEKKSLGYRNGEMELTKLSGEALYKPPDSNLLGHSPGLCVSLKENMDFNDKKINGYQQFLRNLKVKECRENIDLSNEKKPFPNHYSSNSLLLNATSVISHHPENSKTNSLSQTTDSLSQCPGVSCFQESNKTIRTESIVRRKLSLNRKTRHEKPQPSVDEESDFGKVSNLRNKGNFIKRTKRSSANYGRNAFTHLLGPENAVDTDEEKSHRKARSLKKDKLKEGVHYIIIGKFKGYKRMVVKICNSQVNGDVASVKDFLEANKNCRICKSVQKQFLISEASNTLEFEKEDKDIDVECIVSTKNKDTQVKRITCTKNEDTEVENITGTCSETVSNAEHVQFQIIDEVSSKTVQSADSTSTSTSNSDSNIENDPELKDDSSCDAVYGRNRQRHRRKALTRNQRLGVAFVTKRTKRKRAATPTCGTNIMNSLSILHQATLAGLSDVLTNSDKCDDYKTPMEDVMHKLAFTSPPTSDPGDMSPPVPTSPGNTPPAFSDASRTSSTDPSSPSLSKENSSNYKVNDHLLSPKPIVVSKVDSLLLKSPKEKEKTFINTPERPSKRFACGISLKLKSQSLILGKVTLKTPTKYAKNLCKETATPVSSSVTPDMVLPDIQRSSDNNVDNAIPPDLNGCILPLENSTGIVLEDSQSHLDQIAPTSISAGDEQSSEEKSKLRKEGFVKMLDFSRNVNHVKEMIDSTCAVQSDHRKDSPLTLPESIQEATVKTSDFLPTVSQDIKSLSKCEDVKRCIYRRTSSSKIRIKPTVCVKKPVEYLETGLSAKDLIFLTNSKRPSSAPVSKVTVNNFNSEHLTMPNSPLAVPSSQPVSVSTEDCDIDQNAAPFNLFGQRMLHVQNDLCTTDTSVLQIDIDGNQKNIPTSLGSVNGSCKMVVAPLIPPPSADNVRDTAAEYSILLHKPTEPFCSIQADVPEKNREIGGRVLKMNSYTVNNSVEFRSESTGCGLNMWRSILTSDDPFSQNIQADLIEKLEMEQDLRHAVIGDHSRVICPCLPSPSAQTVKQWLNVKKKEKDLAIENVCKPISDTKIVTSNLKIRKTDVNKNIDDSLKQKPSGEDVLAKADLNKTEFIFAPKSKHKFESQTNCTTDDFLSNTITDQFVTPVKVLAIADGGSPPHSTPVQSASRSAFSTLPCTPIQSIRRPEPQPYEVAKKCPPRRRLSANTDKSLRKSLLASQVLNLSTPSTSKADTSQIDGPTPKNTYGFRYSQNNAPDSKALHEVQYITILSVEVHVETRGDRKPDPEQDPIVALFYSIRNDIPAAEKGPTEVNGVIVVNEAAAIQPCSTESKKSEFVSTQPCTNKEQPESPQPSTSSHQPSTSSHQPSTSSHQPSCHQVVQDSAPVLTDTLFQRSGLANVVTTYVHDEQCLFQEFLKIIRRWDPDILVGYEIQIVSLGYLLNRASHLGTDLCTQISRVPDCKRDTHISIEKDEYGADHMSEIHVAGRIILNLWRIMRHEVTLNLYTFENVAFHVLHERLPNYSHSSLTNWFNHRTHLYRWRVVDYYMKRAKGNLELMEQLNLIGRTSEFARVFGIEFFHVLSRGSQYRVESMMLRLAKPLNIIPVSPNVQQRARMKAPECIQLTLEPESRFYTHPVIVLDFQSLYPSIMIAYNYCFSTCLGRLTNLAKAQDGAMEFGCTSLSVKPSLIRKLKDDVTISPNGVVFVKQHVRKGIISSMVEEILNTRIMVKKEMKAYKDDKGLSRLLHARQLGLKLIANVTYGYTAANFSGRMPCVEVGDSIVRKARETLERAINLVENTPIWRGRVVYGDTDSMFIELKGRTKEEAFKIGYEIAEAVTAMNPKPIKLRFEKVYLPCVLQTKKRYFGYMYETPDQKEPEFDAKGVETVRRDNCPAVSKMLERCIKLLFTTRDVSQIKHYVIKQCTKLLEGRVSLQDCIFAKEYRGMSGYKPGACVPALEIAKKRLRYDRRSEPRVGERVPYVIVYGSPGLPLIQLVRQPSELLQDSSFRLNTTYYITKQILPPLQRFLGLIGVDVISWYQEMPRIVKVMPGAHFQGENKKGIISQYFSVANCPVCDEQTKDQLCVKCQCSPQMAVCQLNERMRQWEKSQQHILKLCGSCMGVDEAEPSCVSYDCPVLFRLNRAKLDCNRTEQLRNVIRDIL